MRELYPYLPHLLLAYTTYVFAAASPGPSNLAIMGIAMAQGRRPRLALAAGVISGSMTWAILAAFGVSAVLASYANALIVLKIFGGCYLLWLAFKSLRSALRGGAAPTLMQSAPLPSRQLYLRGLALHLTNPKAILAWIAIVTLGLPAGAPRFVSFAIVAGCAILGIVIFSGYALLFSAPPMVRTYQRARRGIEGVLAAVFGLAGLRLLIG